MLEMTANAFYSSVYNMPAKTESYKCDFCNRHFHTMSSARRHERDHCYNNESRKCCRNCSGLSDCREFGLMDGVLGININNNCEGFKNKHSLTDALHTQKKEQK